MSPLWTKARDVLRTLFRCCGEPQEIAQQSFIPRKLYAHFLAWIRAGEILLRRVLLLEAIALGPRASRPQVRKHKPRQRKRVEFFPDKPDDWRVSFRFTQKDCGLPARKRSQPTAAPCGLEARGPLQTFFSPWPLALRAEALLRVCNTPAPYIARLARLIARVPKVIARIVKRPHQRKRQSGDPPPTINIIGRDLWGDVELALSDTS